MKPLLQVSGLRKAFGGVVAADRLDLRVGEGEILGLIGPNGSGKSTTLNLISGALKADAGSILLDGEEIAGLPAHQRVRRRVARTFQLVRVLPGMTVADNLMAGLVFGAEPRSRRAASALVEDGLARVGLAGKADLPAGQLTYIDQKRVELARALATGPRLVLLDEWLSGLNPTELLEGIELVGRLPAQGVSVILVEHVMSAVRALCHRAVVMNTGRIIAEGTPGAVLADPEVIRAYLGDEEEEPAHA